MKVTEDLMYDKRSVQILNHRTKSLGTPRRNDGQVSASVWGSLAFLSETISFEVETVQGGGL